MTRSIQKKRNQKMKVVSCDCFNFFEQKGISLETLRNYVSEESDVKVTRYAIRVKVNGHVKKIWRITARFAEKNSSTRKISRGKRMIYDVLLESRTCHRVLIEADNKRELKENIWKIGADLDYKNAVPVNIYEIKGLASYRDINNLKEILPFFSEGIHAYRIENGIVKFLNEGKEDQNNERS